MHFFDTHTHLDYLAQDLFPNMPLDDSVPTLVENAAQAGVMRLLVVAVSAKNFAKVTACHHAAPAQIVYGLGLHPLYIAEHRLSDLDELERQLERRPAGLVALAEIGLEQAVSAACTPELWQKQLAFFDAQLQLAKRYDLPVNLHSRKSHEILHRLLKQAALPKTGVVHGFAGSYEQAKRFVDLGYKIGVGGTITYARANKTRQAIAKLPLEALLLETDCPDMPVCGFQGQPNRPERLRQTFQALCELRPESAEQIAETIWQSSERLFWR